MSAHSPWPELATPSPAPRTVRACRAVSLSRVRSGASSVGRTAATTAVDDRCDDVAEPTRRRGRGVVETDERATPGGHGIAEASFRLGAEAFWSDRHRGASEEATEAVDRGRDLDARQMAETLGEREERPAADEKLRAPDARMHTGQNLIAEPGSGARVAVALQARIECDDRGGARTGGRRG